MTKKSTLHLWGWQRGVERLFASRYLRHLTQNEANEANEARFSLKYDFIHDVMNKFAISRATVQWCQLKN